MIVDKINDGSIASISRKKMSIKNKFTNNPQIYWYLSIFIHECYPYNRKIQILFAIPTLFFFIIYLHGMFDIYKRIFHLRCHQFTPNTKNSQKVIHYIHFVHLFIVLLGETRTTRRASLHWIICPFLCVSCLFWPNS